jgi:DNA polymerase (family 10)
MENSQIADTFSLLSKLMDIHGENSFKSKSYSSAAFSIDKLLLPLKDLPVDKIASIKGVGTSSAQKIIELIQNGRIFFLEELIEKTPPGVIEMLSIKGIGPKKIHTIWKEMEIETIGELLYACKENRLKLYKGFGEKTQQNVIESIEFYLKNQGSHLYAQIESIADEIEAIIQEIFKGKRIEATGKFVRQFETIDELEYIIEISMEELEEKISSVDFFSLKTKDNNTILYATQAGIDIKFYPSSASQFIRQSIMLSSSADFQTALFKEFSSDLDGYSSEKDFFEKNQIAYIPPFLRETPEIITIAKNNVLPEIIQKNDIKGVIHCHSNWSDGSNTIEEMAQAAIERGMEYLVLSDHSKSAFYAQGLYEEKIKAQHQLIDELNEKLAPFKIFKSIESDILNDGSLDYSDAVLSTFDLVIASVHSNLKMSQEKAMARLLRAIENPYTSILGHMTGRLLLSRPGYPLDFEKIIEACAENNVVIELNAHPNRLDIDWRQIPNVLKKNVLISINPDAHQTDGIDVLKYGVLTAQKAMVTKNNNLSSFSLKEFENFIEHQKNTKLR